MSRAWRIEYAGAGYHVMNRGVAGCKLFRTSEDRERFEEILSQSVDRFALELAAYVLMDNHHLCEASHST